MRTPQLIAFTALALLGIAQASPRAEDSYPTRPVKLVVGYPPGGPTDVIGRIIAKNLTDELGQQFLVENLGGAGGTTGALNVSRAAPDGYTLLTSVEASQTRAKIFYPRVAYDQIKSFTFLRKMVKQRTLLVVRPDLPVKSVSELIVYAKAHPKELNYGGTLGTTSQIGGSVFNKLHGTEMTFVSYPGGNLPITDLMGGTVQVGFFTESNVAELIRAGKLRALAVAAADHSVNFPDLPTIEEAGGKPMDISAWFGVVGPAGLPPAVVARLSTALTKISDSTAFASQLQFIGASPIKESNSESFSSDVSKEISYWTDWSKQNKISD